MPDELAAPSLPTAAPARAEAEAQLADLLARAQTDPDVLGLLLFGSRGFEAYVTETSDVDAMLVVATDPAPWRTPHGSPVEVWPMTLEAFRSHALAGSSEAWNRPTFLGVRVLVDRLEGEIGRLAAAKASLAPDEARALAAAAADDYLNSLYRSLRNLEAGRELEGRLDGLESLAPLLATAFALDGRVRPFNKWLRHELARRPLTTDGLLEAVASIAGEPTPANQRHAFRLMEAALRAAGHGSVVDGWQPDVAWLRGPDPTEPAPTRHRMTDHE